MVNAIEETVKHAKLLARHMTLCDDSTVAHVVLCELGVDPKNNGFVYLERAITMRVENPVRQLMDDIYIAISAEFDGIEDNKHIDQAIRRSVADAWIERDIDVWRLFFPYMKKGKERKPSNGDVIARVAWFVELWQGCCKEVEYAQY